MQRMTTGEITEPIISQISNTMFSLNFYIEFDTFSGPRSCGDWRGRDSNDQSRIFVCENIKMTSPELCADCRVCPWSQEETRSKF